MQFLTKSLSTILLLSFISCSGSSGDKVTFITGRILFPRSGVAGTSELPLSNASLVFRDFSPMITNTEANPFLGFSDSNGGFAISIEDARVILLTATGNIDSSSVSASAFVITDGRINSKNLDSFTTLAANSILEALARNFINIRDIDIELIADFEAVARTVSFRQLVNLLEEDSRQAAIEQILVELFDSSEFVDDFQNEDPDTEEEMPESDPESFLNGEDRQSEEDEQEDPPSELI